MTRACDTAELAYLRSDNQASELKLAFPVSNVVFRALINQTFTSLDSVTGLTYDNGVGSDSDVLPGMTLWIGSDTDNLDDIGIARIRYDAADSACITGTNIFIGETSDLALADNQVLTIVDDILPWARHIKNATDITCLMDYDIAYTDQYVNMNPILNMGPDVVYYDTKLSADTDNPELITLDASGSFMANGDTDAIFYQWEARDSNVFVDNADTATPDVYISAAGTFRIKCTATHTNGKTTVGFRTIVIYDATHPPVTQFVVSQPPQGSVNEGGWSFQITLYDQAAFAQVRDRQQVILFSRDWYDGIEISLGPVPGRENIVCVGWIDKDSMHYNPDGSSVTFTVYGPYYWLNKMTGFILGIEDWDGTPDESRTTDWTEFIGLTVDNGLFALLYWRSTIPFFMDVYLTGDTRPLPSLEAPEGSLWEQIKVNANDTIFARPLCNCYGQLYIEVDPQMVPETSRTFPVVINILKSDCEKDKTDVERTPNPNTSRVSASGVEYEFGNNGIGTAFLAFAPGHVFKRFGTAETLEKVLISGQSQLNQLSGLYVAKQNNTYASVKTTLTQNNRFIDICPVQYYHRTIPAEDNPRGIEFDYDIVPNQVIRQFDTKSGFFSIVLDGEAATVEDLSVTGVIPPPEPPDTPPSVPITFPMFMPIPWSVPVVPGIINSFIMLTREAAMYADTAEYVSWTGYDESGTSFTFDIGSDPTVVTIQEQGYYLIYASTLDTAAAGPGTAGFFWLKLSVEEYGSYFSAVHDTYNSGYVFSSSDLVEVTYSTGNITVPLPMKVGSTIKIKLLCGHTGGAVAQNFTMAKLYIVKMAEFDGILRGGGTP